MEDQHQGGHWLVSSMEEAFESEVNQQFSCLRIPRAVQSEPSPLELDEGLGCRGGWEMIDHLVI